MPSRGKKKTTMAKLNREARLRERRTEKKARKEARREAATSPHADMPHDPYMVQHPDMPHDPDIPQDSDMPHDPDPPQTDDHGSPDPQGSTPAAG